MFEKINQIEKDLKNLKESPDKLELNQILDDLNFLIQESRDHIIGMLISKNGNIEDNSFGHYIGNELNKAQTPLILIGSKLNLEMLDETNDEIIEILELSFEKFNKLLSFGRNIEQTQILNLIDSYKANQFSLKY